jgi:hypothetical protein
MMADKKLTSVVKPGPSAVSNATATGNQPDVSKTPKQATVSNRNRASDSFTLFHKENYVWMLAGLAIIALGMILMSGGKSNNPNVFDQKEVYSTTRITIAPLLIVIGLAVEVFAIFRKPKV